VSTIDCCEINWDLVQALALLGFQLLARDFLTATPRPIYDRVVMNPPFSKDAYIDHVRAAYHWLAPGGELIAVLPNGYCGSRITKRREFTDWLDDLGVDRYENSADAFTKSDRICGVSTHLISLILTRKMNQLKSQSPIEKLNPHEQWYRFNSLPFEVQELIIKLLLIARGDGLQPIIARAKLAKFHAMTDGEIIDLYHLQFSTTISNHYR
jgi:hypothetical protein